MGSKTSDGAGSMKIYRTDGSGRPDGIVVEDGVVPDPGAGEVAVRIHAVALNYLDLKVIAGTFPGGRAGLVPLSDAAGEVVATGPGVTTLRVGDRVTSTFFPRWQAGTITEAARRIIPGSTVDGVMQEVAVFREEAVVPAPPGLDWAEAATLPCAALTGWQMLTGARPVLPGETVLVQGTGGVALFALQFARLAGARVIVLSSSDEKLARARQLGADVGINYRTTPAWEGPVREATGGRGVDIVVETAGATLPQSLAALAFGGFVGVVGFVAGYEAKIPLRALIGPLNRVQGIAVGSRARFEAMNRAIAQHGLRPVIDSTFPLQRAADAFRHLRDGKHFGKVVLDLQGR